ncbi:Uncharacterised protein [Bordetella pertussis]|nr:Uncharacterised protein [Bordetella pertussis]
MCAFGSRPPWVSSVSNFMSTCRSESVRTDLPAARQAPPGQERNARPRMRRAQTTRGILGSRRSVY